MTENYSLQDLWKLVRKHIKSFKLWALLGCILVLYILTGRALPILFGRSIDQGFSKGDIDSFRIFCYLFIVSGILRATSGFFLFYQIKKECHRISYGLRSALFGHIQRLRIPFFDKTPSGTVVTRMTNDTISFHQLLDDGIVGMTLNAIELLSLFIALFYESWMLGGVVLVTAPLAVFLSVYLAKKVKDNYFTIKTLLSKMNAFVADSFNGFELIQSYRLEEHKCSQYQDQADQYLEKQLLGAKYFAILWPLLDSFQLLTIVICFGAGVFLIQEEMLSTGGLIAFILLLQGFFRPLRFILERFNQIQNGFTSAARIDSIFNEHDEKDERRRTDHLDLEINQALNIKGLNFSYSRDDSQVLRNLSLVVGKNEKVAVVGRTGSGKTTLASILQSFYSPQEEQSVFVYGRPIEEISLNTLRSTLRVVRQEDFVFGGPMGVNVSLAPKNMTDQNRVIEALKFAQITKGPYFEVAHSGSNLSPGERQLLTLARLHYECPEIVIFDEATSFVDEKTENIIQDKLFELFKDKTLIIIAHKPNSVSKCDRIIDLSLLNQVP